MGDAVAPVGAHSPDPILNGLLSQLFEGSDWIGDPIKVTWANHRGSSAASSRHSAEDQPGSDGSQLVDWGVGRFGQQPTALHEALVLIVQRQIRLALEADPHRLHLHGALIGDVACGRSPVLMLGASGAGKSTMAAQLVHLGIAYATDEMVAVDTDCRVEAVRKPLKLRQGAKAHYPYLESLVDPLLSGVTGDVPIAPDAGLWLEEGSTHLNDIVVLSRHDAGPGCPEPCLELQRVPAVTMTRRMAENAFDFSRFGVGRSLLTLARLATSVHCWELYYCDSQQAAPVLAGLAGHAGPSQRADGLPPSPSFPRTSPVSTEPIVLVGDDSVGAVDDSLVGLRMGDAGLVCRPVPPEHIVVELNDQAFDVWQLGRLGIDPCEIASETGLPPDTVLACLSTLRKADLM
jgi:hypothetical protein